MFSRPRIAVVGLSALLSACDHGTGEPPSIAVSTAQPADVTSVMAPSDTVQATLTRYRTTHSDIADKNLDFSIERSRKLAAGMPAAVGPARKLVGELLTRVKFRNRYADLDEALGISSRLLTNTESAQAHLLHAEVLMAIHRYDEALDQLALAADKGASAHELEDRRRRIAVAIGFADDDTIEFFQRAAKLGANYRSYTSLAAAFAAAGRHSEADLAYVNALEHYQDVSPFAVAWVQFSRAELYIDSEPSLAERLYREALHYLPEYVTANVHLAELLLTQGGSEEALLRLQNAAAYSADPDIYALLARYTTQDSNAVARYALDAEQGFKRLLQRHELAFAQHAVEFYSGPGNNAKLAEDLELRLTEQLSKTRGRLTTSAATDRS